MHGDRGAVEHDACRETHEKGDVHGIELFIGFSPHDIIYGYRDNRQENQHVAFHACSGYRGYPVPVHDIDYPRYGQ